MSKSTAQIRTKRHTLEQLLARLPVNDIVAHMLVSKQLEVQPEQNDTCLTKDRHVGPTLSRVSELGQNLEIHRLDPWAWIRSDRFSLAGTYQSVLLSHNFRSLTGKLVLVIMIRRVVHKVVQ